MGRGKRTVARYTKGAWVSPDVEERVAKLRIDLLRTKILPGLLEYVDGAIADLPVGPIAPTEGKYFHDRLTWVALVARRANHPQATALLLGALAANAAHRKWIDDADDAPFSLGSPKPVMIGECEARARYLQELLDDPRKLTDESLRIDITSRGNGTSPPYRAIEEDIKPFILAAKTYAEEGNYSGAHAALAAGCEERYGKNDWRTVATRDASNEQVCEAFRVHAANGVARFIRLPDAIGIDLVCAVSRYQPAIDRFRLSLERNVEVYEREHARLITRLFGGSHMNGSQIVNSLRRAHRCRISNGLGMVSDNEYVAPSAINGIMKALADSGADVQVMVRPSDEARPTKHLFYQVVVRALGTDGQQTSFTFNADLGTSRHATHDGQLKKAVLLANQIGISVAPERLVARTSGSEHIEVLVGTAVPAPVPRDVMELFGTQPACTHQNIDVLTGGEISTVYCTACMAPLERIFTVTTLARESERMHHMIGAYGRIRAAAVLNGEPPPSREEIEKMGYVPMSALTLRYRKLSRDAFKNAIKRR